MHKFRLVKGGKLTPGGKPTLQLTRWGRISPRKTDPSVGFPWGKSYTGAIFPWGKSYTGTRFPGEILPRGRFSGGDFRGEILHHNTGLRVPNLPLTFPLTATAV